MARVDTQTSGGFAKSTFINDLRDDYVSQTDTASQTLAGRIFVATTADLIAALAANYPIVTMAPNTTFSITSALMPLSDTILEGGGIGTLISGVDGINGLFLDGVSDVTLRDFAISGCGHQLTHWAIEMEGCSNITCDNVVSKDNRESGFRTNIKGSTRCSNIKFLNCQAVGNHVGSTNGDGFDIAYADHVKLLACKADDNQDSAYAFYNSSYADLIGCQGSNSVTNDGVTIRQLRAGPSTNIRIIGGEYFGNAKSGIALGTALSTPTKYDKSTMKVIGADIYSNSEHGILIQYIIPNKKVTLEAAGYVSCVAGDIGKQVQDDASEIGLLVSYDNTNRIWEVDTKEIVAAASAMTITAGTGAGTSVGSASVVHEDSLATLASVIQDCNIYSNTYNGIYLYRGATMLRILGDTVYLNGQHGLRAISADSDLVIYLNTFGFNHFLHNTNEGLQLETNCDKNQIWNNVALYNGTAQIEYAAATNTTDANNITT